MAKTFHGRIEDTLDALVIFEACRQGVLPKLHRRLCSAEKGETRDRPHELESPLLPTTTSTSSSSSSRSSRHPTLAPKASSPPPSSTIHYQSQNLITPGSVFVFDEAEAKICRWTDGRIWSPSRICGNFLVYHELYRKLPKQKCSTAQAKANVRDGHGLKDKALREKVEQDGLVVLGSRKGTFVLKKDGLIKKTICVRGIRLPPLDQLQSAPSVASGASKTGGGGGGGGRRGAKSAESRVTGVSFTGTQHLVCYEQAGAMEGLYRPRDYVELREIFLSKTFVTNQKLRDPVRVKPLPADQTPVEPTDEYIRQTRIVEVRTPPKPTLPPTEPAARSTPTSRKGSSPVSRLRGKRSSETKATNILNHPYPTRGQDRQLREILEESQALETSGSKCRSASRLHTNVDQINEDYKDEATSGNGGSGETRVPPDPNDMKNTQLHLEPLAKHQICESNRQEYDDMMEYPTNKIFRNSKRRKNYSQVEESDTSERVLSQIRYQERPPRCVDNDATERSSSKMSSPATVTDSDSPEGYIPYPNAEYQTMPQQVLQRQLQDRLQLHQTQEQQRIEYQKSMRYESSDGGSVGNPHSNAISSASMTSWAGEPKSTGIISEEEHTENVGSWTAGVDFGEVRTEQKGIAEELAREQMSDSGPIGSAQVTEWADTDVNNEATVRHAAGPVYDVDMLTVSDGHCPKRVPDWHTLSDSLKEPDYNGQLIGRIQPWSSPFDPESSSERQRRTSGEYLTSINYEDLESPPTVDNGARDRRELTSSRTVPTGFNPWTQSQPIQIMSHVHINPRRRPNVTIESSQPAEDDTSTDANEYLLYSHHQPAILEVVQDDTVPAHDEPPSAHLGSEEDPFFSDLRAHGIGGRSCLAVHASSSPMEPSSAADEHDDEPRDGSAKNQF
ncbi:hypothetical protein BG005_005280 [Podila minutissima]|nr:hypothetical protein BG005_005280 [Podila minutissima]